MAVGTSLLGLNSAAITAVGADLVGDFVRNYLQKEGMNTDFVMTKMGRTAVAKAGIGNRRLDLEMRVARLWSRGTGAPRRCPFLMKLKHL